MAGVVVLVQGRDPPRLGRPRQPHHAAPGAAAATPPPAASRPRPTAPPTSHLSPPPSPLSPYASLPQEAFSKETGEDIRLGALELMTSLYYSQGRFLSIGVNETTTLAAKYCLK